MPLPQNKIDQIKKDAEAIFSKGKNLSWDRGHRSGYITGASTEAERAQATEAIGQKMADALRELYRHTVGPESIQIINKVLSAWEGRNKEVGYEKNK